MNKTNACKCGQQQVHYAEVAKFFKFLQCPKLLKIYLSNIIQKKITRSCRSAFDTSS